MKMCVPPFPGKRLVLRHHQRNPSSPPPSLPPFLFIPLSLSSPISGLPSFPYYDVFCFSSHPFCCVYFPIPFLSLPPSFPPLFHFLYSLLSSVFLAFLITMLSSFSSYPLSVYTFISLHLLHSFRLLFPFFTLFCLQSFLLPLLRCCLLFFSHSFFVLIFISFPFLILFCLRLS